MAGGGRWDESGEQRACSPRPGFRQPPAVGKCAASGSWYTTRGSVDGELNGAMILKIIIGWAVTIPLAMLVTVLAYAALLPAYEPDPVCNGAPP